MTKQNSSTPRIPVTRRLDHLPIVANTLNRLGVRKIIDELVPKDPRSHVSTGECVEVLVTAILLGKHTLYRVVDLLQPYDLRVAFGFEVTDPRHFNDERLAKALTDLFYRAGVNKVNSSMLLATIREYELSLRRIHLDTTSVSVYGEYHNSSSPGDPEAHNAIPHVTYGYSKDRRPDLKQVIYGLAVAGDGAVPVFGRVSSGNRADPLEFRHMLERLRESLPDPGSVLYVGDSKLFSGETLALILAYDLQFVTLMPRSVGLWEKAYGLFRGEADLAPILKEKAIGELSDDADEDTRPRHFWRGRSYDMTYEFEFDGSDYAVNLRVLVVESDALKARKAGSIRRRETREQTKLEKLVARYGKRVYSCAKDAERVMERLRQRAFAFHSVEFSLVAKQQRKKRKSRGRPRKGELPEFETVWQIAVAFSPDPGAFERILRRETCFALVTNVLVEEERTEADRLTLADYDGQDSVERAFRWTKHPLQFAPIFLEREDRIAALGLVYVITLMVYALIQRDARERLQQADTTMPGNKGWTNKPTTEVIFRLMENLNTVSFEDADAPIYVTNLNTEQVRVLDLLGVDLCAYPSVKLGEVRKPRPGERAFKPVPRSKRKKRTIS